MKQQYHTFNRLLVVTFCLVVLVSCAPGGPGPSGDPDGELQPTKAPNYLSDPKFDTGDALPQYDHDKSWTHRLGGSDSCATEDTLYFAAASNSRHYIYCCDLATGISGPLCGKAECPHNDERCNAYTKDKAVGLSVYDGKLYWITPFDEESNPAIYCMGLDGTNRIKVCSMPSSPLFEKVTGNLIFLFHRGYAIYGGKSRAVSDGVTSRGVMVCAVSLSTGEETVILDQMFDEGTVPEVELVPYRNKLYLFVNSAPAGAEVKGKIMLSISEWSLKTHETRSLYAQTGDVFFEEAWAVPDGLLLSSAMDGNVYKFDSATRELELLFDVNAGGRDEGRMKFAGGYLISWTLNEDRVPHIHATDLEGNVVYSEDLDLPDWPSRGYGYALAGADSGNFYLRLRLSAGRGVNQNSRTVMVQVPLDGKGSVRELWSANELDPKFVGG